MEVVECAICKHLDEERTYDFVRGDETPPQLGQLIRIASEVDPAGFPETLEKCPTCGAIYLDERNVDNDIIQPTDELTLTRLTPERVRAWHAKQDARTRELDAAIAVHARKARAHLKAVLPTLGDDERAVFDYLLTRGDRGAYVAEIENRCGLTIERAAWIVGELLRREIIQYAGAYRDSRELSRYALRVR